MPDVAAPVAIAARPEVAARLATPARLLSLDAFRGLTMAGMTVVNNPGDWNHVHPPLLHAQWHGCTPTDWIFPFFLFIVGVAITLSRKSGHWSPIAIRAAKLFGLGLFLNGFPFFNLATLRVPGVLQRIALCYLAAALLYRSLRPAHSGADMVAADRRTARVVTVVTVVLLVGYWAVLMLVPGANGYAGDLTPEGNVGAVLDRAVFGTHQYRTTWDPEGLFSTLPAVGTTLLGILAGLWMRNGGSRKHVLLGLAGGGLALVLAGLAWGTVFPLNKALWTSSYVLYTAGLGALLLAVCYGTIDVAGWRRWAHPFVVLGMNAIALYVLSGLVAELLSIVKVPGGGERETLKALVYDNLFVPVASPMNASLLFALAFLAAMYVPMWAMYRRGIFLKV